MYSVKIIVLIFILTSCLQSQQFDKCLNLIQEIGKCSQCPIKSFLYNGFCYQMKIGCDQLLTPQMCFSCQFGYQLQNLQCVSDLQRIQENSLNNSSKKQNAKLIKLLGSQKINELNFIYLNKVNQFFRKKKYQIRNAQILFIDAIQSDNGFIVSIGYFKSSVYFQAAGSIDYLNNIKELFFVKSIQSLQMTQNNQKNRKQFKNQLQNSTLESMEYNEKENILSMFYISQDKLSLYKVENNLNLKGLLTIRKIQEKPSIQKAQKIALFYAPQLSKIAIKDYSEKDLNTSIEYSIKYQNEASIKVVYDKQKKQYAFNEYQILISQDEKKSRPLPGGYFQITDYKDQNFIIIKKYLSQNYQELKKLEIKKVQLQVANGLNVKISYKDSRTGDIYQALVSKSLAGQIFVRQILKNEINILKDKKFQAQIDTLLGGFTKIVIEEDPYFKNIEEKIRTDLQFLSKAKIEAAGIQVVSGLIYKVVMTQGSDVYLVEVYQNLKKQLSILSILKNGKNIYLPKLNEQPKIFDWKSDENFNKGYQFFKKEVNILNFLPIEYVNKAINGSQILYTILYSPNEYGSLKYIGGEDKFQVLSYILQGTQLYKSNVTSNVDFLNTNRSSQQLLDFLKKEQSQYFSIIYLKSLMKILNVYTVEVASPLGIYQAQIQDNKNLNLKRLQLKLKSNCFELSDDQIISDANFTKVQSYLRKTLDIKKEFKVQVAQVQVNAKFLKYRILYTNINNKRLQIIATLDQKSINIIDSQVLNDGYQNIQYQQLSGILLKANPITQKTYKEILGKSQMVNAQKNLTNTKLIYSDKYSTYQVVFSQDLGKSKLNKLQDKKPKLPEGFKVQNVISQQKIKDQSFFTDFKNKLNDKLGHYIFDAQILLISVQSITGGKSIKILFEGKQGIFEAIGKYSQSKKQSQIQSFILTSIRKSEFLQCNELTKQNEINSISCKNCLPDEIDNYGLCFKKIDGCQTQVGNICISCSKKWNKVQNICIKDCQRFF